MIGKSAMSSAFTRIRRSFWSLLFLFNPILMTSFSTVLGIMPLVIATGAGAASRQAIGITIVTGFTIGTLFTLFVLPVVYTFFAGDHRPAIEESETLMPSQLV